MLKYTNHIYMHNNLNIAHETQYILIIIFNCQNKIMYMVSVLTRTTRLAAGHKQIVDNSTRLSTIVCICCKPCSSD